MIKDAQYDLAIETDDPINRAESIAIAFADEDAVPLHRHVPTASLLSCRLLHGTIPNGQSRQLPNDREQRQVAHIVRKTGAPMHACGFAATT
jgi:hypothetical protein